jgi:diguanylate cyclase (GGDEF)-like protein
LPDPAPRLSEVLDAISGYAHRIEALSPGKGTTLIRAAAALLGTAGLLILGIALAGGDFTDALDDLVTLLLAVAVVAALAGWARERRSGAARAALDEQRRGRMDERARALEEAARASGDRGERLERQLQEQREALRHEQRLRLRIERARQAEREWTRELREQVLRSYRSSGGTSDVHELVLEVATRLSQAECGLLLSKRDADGDGRLDLVCHTGFRNDPADSSVAQRFAERVLERDEIVREDAPGDGVSAADKEIESLVAIPVYMNDGFEGVVVCANRPGGFEELDDDVLLALGDHAGAVLENHRLQGRVRSSYLAVVGILADAVENTGPFVDSHAIAISQYVDRVTRHLGFDPARREQLLFTGLLRDVGKLGISERVLLKPGRLTPQERNVIELHPEIGARIVERVPGLAGLAPGIRHHHERWDGQGYPDGLRGEEIPVEARVVALVDCFSALISTRPYRQRLTAQEACVEIGRCAGSQFDPEIAALFVEEVRHQPPEPPYPEALPAILPALASAEEALATGRLGAASAAASDNVTLLHSHRYLQEVAAREAERAARTRQPFAVAMIELSELSTINRRESYAAGDMALQAAARSLERTMAGEPATIGRYSGRRLAVVLPGNGNAGPAERRVQMVEQLERLERSGPRMRVGVAQWQPGDHGEDVFARARLVLEATPEAT